MKRFVFRYHFPKLLVKHCHQVVITEGCHWTAAAAKADREVSKRKGVKGQHGATTFKRACAPVEDKLDGNSNLL